MSAMGERFLILEETADALDVIDPELAVQFRVVNGLPRQPRDELSTGPGPTGPSSSELKRAPAPPKHHEIRMDVGDHHIQSVCSCGEWTSAVGWDEIDDMVARIRDHVGAVGVSSPDGITATEPSVSASGAEKRVG